MIAPNIRSPDGRHVVYFADSRHMVELPENEVDLVVTSPPYFIGAPYGDTPGQIEGEPTNLDDYHQYLRSLESVWTECYRVMKPGAYMAINVPPTHAKAETFGESFLLGIPEDTLTFCRDILGMQYKAKYLWQSTRNVTNHAGDGTRVLGSYLLPLEGGVIRKSEDILILRKPKGLNWKPDPDRERRRRESAFKDMDDWMTVFSQIWEFPGANKETTGGVQHPAPFPLELPSRVIRGYSVKDDLVLDPFVGTGTSIWAAMNLGRRSVSYEIERRFDPHIRAKTHMDVPSLEAHY